MSETGPSIGFSTSVADTHAADEIADTEEGIKRYTKQVFSEIMDVVHSIVPKGDVDFDDRDPEEIKGHHSR
jgi:hypothetical protein